MSDKIGRNDPCPCGSGKKYKKCCMSKSHEETSNSGFSPKYKFEPGSYGGHGGFMPSVACLKQTPDNRWKYHFVLVSPDQVHIDEDVATAQATQDLEVAFAKKGETGSDFTIAEELRGRGYLSVENFKIIVDI